jgi:hypothetical protein
VGGDAVAIRSALSDEGPAPLDTPGLRLDPAQHAGDGATGGSRPLLTTLLRPVERALDETAVLWVPIRRADTLVWLAAAGGVAKVSATRLTCASSRSLRSLRSLRGG